MKKQRDSNYELLRILAMLSILLGHILLLGQVLDNTRGIIHLILTIIMFTIIVHVNVFILITGYFQYDKKTSFKKIINLLLEIFFYKLLIDLTLYFTGFVKIPTNNLILDLFPLNLESYWFISNYIILYLIIPYLNKLIKSFNKNETKRYLTILIICFSILPYFTLRLFIGYNGYSLCNMILMYSIGAVLKKYQVINYIKNNINYAKTKTFMIFIVSIIINLSLFLITAKIGTLNIKILSQLANMINELSLNYNNIFIIIQAISLFLLFGMFNIHSKIVNKIASATLAVYLIHENSFMRENIYKWIGISTGKIHYSYSIFVDIIFWVITIFTISIIIELMRKKLFKIFKFEFK